MTKKGGALRKADPMGTSLLLDLAASETVLITQELTMYLSIAKASKVQPFGAGSSTSQHRLHSTPSPEQNSR